MKSKRTFTFLTELKWQRLSPTCAYFTPCPVLTRLPEKPSFWFRQRGFDEFHDVLGALKADVREYATSKCRVVDLVREYDPARHVLHYCDEYQVALSDRKPD